MSQSSIKGAFDTALERVLGDPFDPAPVDASEGDLVTLLAATDAAQKERLMARAREVRDRFCGRRMVVRALIEFSSYCRNSCFYCGLNRNNLQASRYRLGADEILESVALAWRSGIRTVVLQSGEDGLDAVWLAGVIEDIKQMGDMAVTLSVGERSREDYALWRRAGADRYLLRIETTDPALYRSLHEGREVTTRLACLETLREEGYQVGSGFMVGPPGQTIEHIARDIRFLAGIATDMIGVGPFIPHPDTPFRDAAPGDVGLTLRVLAVLRLVTRRSWMPATTALGSLDRDYRIDALKAGANVLMPNFSPASVKKQYAIYPGKRCVDEPTGACAGCTAGLAHAGGLEMDWSRADSLMHEAPGELRYQP